jgi:hypothetical protein
VLLAFFPVYCSIYMYMIVNINNIVIYCFLALGGTKTLTAILILLSMLCCADHQYLQYKKSSLFSGTSFTMFDFCLEEANNRRVDLNRANNEQRCVHIFLTFPFRVLPELLDTTILEVEYTTIISSNIHPNHTSLNYGFYNVVNTLLPNY